MAGTPGASSRPGGLRPAGRSADAAWPSTTGLGYGSDMPTNPTRALMVGATIALTLTACEPTGDVRCDAHSDILDEIESHDWTINCAPEFDNRGTTDGGQTWFPIWGWADKNTQTVWIWPQEVTHDPDRTDVRRGDGIGEWIVRDDHMRYLLWHELAHVTGIADEDDADAYSWCREPLFGRGPSTKTCEALGA